MEDLEGWRTIGQLEGKVDGLVSSVHSMTSALNSSIAETRQEIKTLGERMARLEKSTSGNSNGSSKIRIREVIALAAALTGAGGSATLWTRYSEVAARLDYVQRHVVSPSSYDSQGNQGNQGNQNGQASSGMAGTNKGSMR